MKLVDIIKCAKDNNLNVRVCFNLTNEFNSSKPGEIIMWAKNLNVDQVTFRKLYAAGGTPEAKWIQRNQLAEETYVYFMTYVQKNGQMVGILPYGQAQFDVHGVSVVVDDDCMAKRGRDIKNIRYAILRPNGHLYTSWDYKGSLIF